MNTQTELPKEMNSGPIDTQTQSEAVCGFTYEAWRSGEGTREERERERGWRDLGSTSSRPGPHRPREKLSRNKGGIWGWMGLIGEVGGGGGGGSSHEGRRINWDSGGSSLSQLCGLRGCEV
jgi:hypothetical protein